jgi:glycosyltransferase involved in cell wall biosynthesis
MSLPVITTTVVGASCDLVIDGYNGLIVQENNIVALYGAMNKILDCDSTQMGINARRTFEKQNNFAKMADGFTRAIAHTERQL